jgi:uncharacterized membrane-anchored protein
MFSSRLWIWIVLLACMNGVAQAGPPLTPEEQRVMERYQRIRWQQGEGLYSIGSQATIRLPRGFQLADPAGAQDYMELNGNPPDPNCLGIVTLTDNPFTWFLVFTYTDTGRVDESDASSINPDELLKQIRDNTIVANEQRKRAAQEQLFVDGWITPPRYNTSTKRLEWACRMHSENGHLNANWDTRILGRHGVMSVKLVAPPDQIESLLPMVNGLLQGVAFKAGQDYASWQQGDKVAAFGMAALVTGSTTAVAAKLGFFQKFGLFIAKFFYVIVAAVGAVFWRFFGGSSDSATSADPLKAGNADSPFPPRPGLPAPSPQESEKAGEI